VETTETVVFNNPALSLCTAFNVTFVHFRFFKLPALCQIEQVSIRQVDRLLRRQIVTIRVKDGASMRIWSP
jgi:hypothetical protein